MHRTELGMWRERDKRSMATMERILFPVFLFVTVVDRIVPHMAGQPGSPYFLKPWTAHTVLFRGSTCSGDGWNRTGKKSFWRSESSGVNWAAAVLRCGQDLGP